MSNKDTSQTLQIDQKRLGGKGLIIFLALLSAFVPLSTDLYLPALPTMTRYFHVQDFEINLTLILFFIFFSIGTLIWGPLSDKYGRRPILLIGLAVYAVASALCAVSMNVYFLMFARILQASGGSVASALASAIVKDTYTQKKRESILALVQSMVVVSPAVAPVIGALLMQFTSWRGIFVAQVLLGIVAFLGAAAFSETLGARSDGNLLQTVGRLGVVLKNPRFAALLLIFSLLNITTMAFISSSSYIYQDAFGLSSRVYSYFFTFNAAGMLLGPLLYIRISNLFKRYHIINVCFIVMIAGGALVSLFGRLSPWLFAAVLLPATIAVSCSRPPSTYLMLEQQKEDSGSASSLMSSVATIMGSIGMILISIYPNSLILTVGLSNVIIGILSGGFWLFSTNRPLLKKVREM